MSRRGIERENLSVTVTADRTGKLFTDINGAPIGTAGIDAFGVLRDTIKSGEVGDIAIFGAGNTAMVTVGSGGLTKGDKVMSDATGKAVLATTGKVILGTALETAAAAADCEILLTKGGGVV